MPSFDRRELAAIFAVGAAGGSLRVWLGTTLGGGAPGWPWVTLAVNATGAFALAYLATRLQERLPISSYRRPLLGTGFCGAYTTFSTWMLETHRLAEEGALARAAVNVAVSLGAGIGAVLLGRAIGMHV